MMTTEITSYFQPGDLQKVLAGTIKYTDPKFVSAFNAINELQTHHCVSPSSSTREQLDAVNDFVAGKVATALAALDGALAHALERLGALVSCPT